MTTERRVIFVPDDYWTNPPKENTMHHAYNSAPANSQPSSAMDHPRADHAQKGKTAGRRGYVCLRGLPRRPDPRLPVRYLSCIFFHHNTTDLHLRESASSVPQLTLSACSKPLSMSRDTRCPGRDAATARRGRYRAVSQIVLVPPGGVR